MSVSRKETVSRDPPSSPSSIRDAEAATPWLGDPDLPLLAAAGAASASRLPIATTSTVTTIALAPPSTAPRMRSSLCFLSLITYSCHHSSALPPPGSAAKASRSAARSANATEAIVETICGTPVDAAARVTLSSPSG